MTTAREIQTSDGRVSGVITDRDLALKVVVRRLPVIDGHDLVGISQAVARAMPDAKIGDLVEAILSVPANG